MSNHYDPDIMAKKDYEAMNADTRRKLNDALNKITYISDQITKAEREGWFDKLDFTNADRCMRLLLAIRNECGK